MRIDWSTLALQTVNAIVLVWLLARFLFRPVARIIEERQKAAQSLLDDASAAKRDAQAERDVAHAATAQLADGRARALAELDAEVAAQRATLVAAAHAEADALRAEARGEIARSRVAQASANSERAASLAVDIAARLLDRLPAQARVAGFIDGIVAGVAQLPPQTRDEVGDGSMPVRITAARELSEDERTACEAALAASLKHPVQIEFSVDPALIAGLELSTSHAVVRNSFRHDLADIRAALVHENGAASTHG